MTEGFEEFDEVIPSALGGERLDRVVALVADVSRREAVALIADHAVRLNDEIPDKPSVRVRTDDRLALRLVRRDDSLVPDPTVQVGVVFLDDEVIVVDKPPHLVVHPGSGVTEATMVHGLLARFPEMATIGRPDRPGIVHRLDKGTSGLLMVARTERAHADLTAQLANRTVGRRYLALVEGTVEADEGLIDAPLGRSPRQPTRRAVVADGRPARTRYAVAERDPDGGWTLLWCRLETGRTHQIRAHLEAIGHPVLADVHYGASPGRAIGLDRPFLHAARLAFEHPVSGERLDFASSPAPDLVGVLERFGLDVDPRPPTEL